MDILCCQWLLLFQVSFAMDAQIIHFMLPSGTSRKLSPNWHFIGHIHLSSQAR
jgi:hypothetical protein